MKIFTPANRNQILKKIAEGLNPVRAAEACGIASSTFRRWMRSPLKHHQKFQEQIKKVQAQMEKERWSPPPVKLSGPSEVVKKKQEFLDILYSAINIPAAAAKAGLSVQQIDEWGIEDPAFEDAVYRARDNANAIVEGYLINLAQKGNATAAIAFLNANDPKYGQVRREILLKYLMPFIDEVSELVRKYIPKNSLDSFSAELDRATLRLLAGQSFKKRRD